MADPDNITKKELAKEIEKILKDADLSKTSTKKVIQKLEKSLGADLTSKKKVIDQLVMDYVNGKDSDNEEDETEEEPAEEEDEKKSEEQESEDEDEKPAKKKKRKGSDADSDGDWRSKKQKKQKKTPVKAKKGAGGRGKGSGYTRAYKLSPALADLMGEDEMPRHEVVKRMWALIKEKNLYDPNNKQFAICDEALYKVIGTKRFRTFGMMKYLKTHFLDE